MIINKDNGTFNFPLFYETLTVQQVVIFKVNYIKFSEVCDNLLFTSFVKAPVTRNGLQRRDNAHNNASP